MPTSEIGIYLFQETKNSALLFMRWAWIQSSLFFLSVCAVLLGRDFQGSHVSDMYVPHPTWALVPRIYTNSGRALNSPEPLVRTSQGVPECPSAFQLRGLECGNI